LGDFKLYCRKHRNVLFVMSKNNTIKKSDKKFIRREKARIRGQFLDVKKQEELIGELYKKMLELPTYEAKQEKPEKQQEKKEAKKQEPKKETKNKTKKK